MTLGEKLKKLRESRGLTQAEIGKFMGISSVGYGYWERNERLPNIHNLLKLASFYNVSIDELTNEVCLVGKYLPQDGWSELRALIQEKKTVRRAVAAKLGVSVEYVKELEDGVRKPLPDELLAIHDYFDADLYYLLGRSKTRIPDEEAAGQDSE